MKRSISLQLSKGLESANTGNFRMLPNIHFVMQACVPMQGHKQLYTLGRRLEQINLLLSDAERKPWCARKLLKPKVCA